jgi:predicted nucleic acid-binding protein
MSIYLLDTSVIIDALNNQRRRGELLTGLLVQGHLLACCSINVTEVYAGMRQDEQASTEELLDSLQFYPVTFPIARLAGFLKGEYSRKGITLTVGDITVAAVALYHHLTLMTDNVKHYPMEGLSLYPLPGA